MSDTSQEIHPNFFLTPESLSNELGMGYETLSKLIYPSPDKNYRSFTIPKKSGGERTISVPNPKLKEVQRKLYKKLVEVYEPRDSCHGFIKGKSIKSNALRHVGKENVFNLDLKDFFGTIHFGRVRNLFLKPPFNYSHAAATVIAQICCYKGVLPQGAPTSPLITNFICWKLDSQLQHLAYKNNCDYTRYADDITFSFTVRREYLPGAIVGFDEERVALVGKTLERIIHENGFYINEKKVRLQSRRTKQTVTGLVVNEFVNVDQKFIRRTSSMIYALERFGAQSAEKEYLEKYRKKSLLERQKKAVEKEDGEFFIDVVKGRVNYIQMIRGRWDPVYRKLAYRITRALGCKNEEFLKTKEELLSKSVFISSNGMDDCQGTAFLLEGVGIVTNQHVVEGVSEENYFEVEFFREIELGNKRTFEFVFSNIKKDLAVFKKPVDLDDIPELKIGDDSKLRYGDQVTIVGYPQYRDNESIFVNRGRIIQKAMLFDNDFFIIDSPIIFGNSGGPILNSQLEVIGIATRGSEKHDARTKFNGFIPISTLLGEIEKRK